MNQYQVSCPNCQQTFAASDEHAGSQTQCQNCCSYFTIPTQQQATMLATSRVAMTPVNQATSPVVVTPTALTPTALTPTALTPTALTPTALTPTATSQTLTPGPEVPKWYKTLTIMGPLCALLLLIGGGAVYWSYHNKTVTSVTNNYQTEITQKPLPPITPHLDPPKAGSEAGERLVIDLGNGVTIAFRWCPSGEFMMGSSRRGDGDEKFHHVRLTKGFWMAETETTQAQWQALMHTNVIEQWKKREDSYQKRSWSKPTVNPILPMNYISWEESQAAVTRLNMHFKGGNPAILPTEAQWEYACKATSLHHLANSYETYSNYAEKTNANYANRKLGVTPAGNYPANPWGLLDMHGNLWEWCSDWYSKKSYDARENITINPMGVAQKDSKDYPKIPDNLSPSDKKRVQQLKEELNSLQTSIDQTRSKRRKKIDSLLKKHKELRQAGKHNSEEYRETTKLLRDVLREQNSREINNRKERENLRTLKTELKAFTKSPSKVCRGGAFYYLDARAANRNHDLITDRSIATGFRFILQVEVQPPVEYASLPTLDTRKPGDKYTLRLNENTSITFCWIPAGSFIMGEADLNKQAYDNPAHPVAITKGFWMAETECTIAQVNAIAASSDKNPELPYTDIAHSRLDSLLVKANSFLYKNIFPRDIGIRLPTEAEWEYACRAETKTAYYTGENILPDQANVRVEQSSSPTSLRPVKNYAPNPWGLYDMHGNAAEWCADTYTPDAYTTLNEENPSE